MPAQATSGPEPPGPSYGSGPYRRAAHEEPAIWDLSPPNRAYGYIVNPTNYQEIGFLPCGSCTPLFPVAEYKRRFLGKRLVAKDSLPDTNHSLRLCVRKSSGAMGRLPQEIIRQIEQAVYNVTTFTLDDLPHCTEMSCSSGPVLTIGDRMIFFLGRDKRVTGFDFFDQ